MHYSTVTEFELTCTDSSGDGDSTTSKSKDESSTSNFSRRQPAKNLRVGTTLGCKAGLVCTSVSSDRSECRPKNPNGTYYNIEGDSDIMTEVDQVDVYKVREFNLNCIPNQVHV